MATYTTHYNLKKPALADKIRIADFNGNADTIDATMYENATLGAQLKADIGIVENTNTASHNISAGQYVIWKGSLYTASSAISSGATLSDANLTAVSGGGLNALNSKINNKINYFVKDISGTQITNIDSGWYYAEISIASDLPTNARAIAITAGGGSWDANVFYDLSADGNIIAKCPTSRTLGTNRLVRVTYYMP